MKRYQGESLHVLPNESVWQIVWADGLSDLIVATDADARSIRTKDDMYGLCGLPVAGRADRQVALEYGHRISKTAPF